MHIYYVFRDIYYKITINTYYNMNKIVRLTESDLHRIVKESVRRVLKEHEIDYGEYGDIYEIDRYERECEKECYQVFYFIPETNQLIPAQNDEDEPDGEYYEVYITPQFCGGDEYGFEMDGVDYEIEGDDGQVSQKYGDTINQLIDDNIDYIYDYIRKNSPYTIY